MKKKSSHQKVLHKVNSRRSATVCTNIRISKTNLCQKNKFDVSQKKSTQVKEKEELIKKCIYHYKLSLDQLRLEVTYLIDIKDKKVLKLNNK